MAQMIIIGAGLAGLSAALTLAEQNHACHLVSLQVSERAQSVLAEGGINAALDVMGEGDVPENHFQDTMRGGVWLSDPNAVRGMTSYAPELVRHLFSIGVPFAMNKDTMIQRNFGGQKKKRTAFCKSSTGKALMTAMIDAVRKYEGTLVTRYPHHRFLKLRMAGNVCRGAQILDEYTGEILELSGQVILACGGPCGMFPGMTTGTTANDGNVLAAVFAQGVEAANLEFIQYHPTTVSMEGKRLLISEASRGEGGRLFINRKDGSRWYFMEEKYPELGNLMPRDVISREMEAVAAQEDCADQVYLDLTVLSKEIWQKKLPDLREQAIHYLGMDPAVTPLPVSPGIHFFMGGIAVDEDHCTNVPGLYAAGECACQYHGANRLGGNSLLGALYGGRIAALTAARKEETGAEMTEGTASSADGYAVGSAAEQSGSVAENPAEIVQASEGAAGTGTQVFEAGTSGTGTPALARQVSAVLAGALGITRDAESMNRALEALKKIQKEQTVSETDRMRTALGEAMLLSAIARKESRGAHQRADYPERDDANYQKTTIASFKDGEIRISFREIPGRRDG